MINVNTIHILVIYTISYNSLIIPKYTFIFNISCINQIVHFTMLFSIKIFHNLKSIQICSQIQFSYAIQFIYVIQFNSANQFSYVHQFNYANQFNYSNQFSYAHQFNYVNQFNYANQFNYSNQFSYALNEFNLCLRYTGYQSHRHGPAGLLTGYNNQLVNTTDTVPLGC